MYFHIVPALINKTGEEVKIESIQIQELGVSLNEDDLFLRTPYPNKNYVVGMLKKDGAKNKAVIGFLVKAEKEINHLTVKTNWVISNNYTGKSRIIEHETNIAVLKNDDEKGDLVSQEIIINFGHNSSAGKKYDARVYDGYKNMAPIYISANILLSEKEIVSDREARKPDLKEFEDGKLKRKIDTLHLYPIEKERIDDCIMFPNRYPKWENAIIK